jgi:uncharacterized protein (TIGR02246 family)
MQTDEQEIRQLVSDWMYATKAGDIDRVLTLMADDAIFLVPGRPPMRKADFEATSREMAGEEGPEFDGSSDIQELEILGDWAYMWQKLTVITTLPDGSPPVKRQGHTLTIFKKQDGRWVLFRDANMLTPVVE